MKLFSRYQVLEIPRTSTARNRVATTLTQEILDNPESKSFLIPSEHQLCRRFNVSRVTARLALNELRHLGHNFLNVGKLAAESSLSHAALTGHHVRDFLPACLEAKISRNHESAIAIL
jgi:hypothetical protein